MRHRAAEDETPRLDARHLVDLASSERLHQLVHSPTERARIAQERCDVAEHDPGLGIVGNGADGVCQVHGRSFGAVIAEAARLGYVGTEVMARMGPTCTRLALGLLAA